MNGSGDHIELLEVNLEESTANSKQAKLKEHDQKTIQPEDNGLEVTTLPTKVKDNVGNSKEKTKSPRASIREIFSFATPIDFLLMFVGILCAIVQGTALPLAMLFFGDVTNTFINYEVSRSTVDLFYNGLTLESLNATHTLYFTPDPINPLNCSLLEPVVQSYYASTMVVCEDQLNNISGVLPLDTVIDRNTINCTVYNEVFTQLYGNVAQCINKDLFISTINSQIIYFVIIGCAAFLLGFGMLSSFHVSSERQVYKMRLAYYTAVLRQDIAWFDLNPAGQISSRLSDDFDKILSGLGYNFALLFQWLSTFFTGFIVGFVRDWRLTLLLIALVPFLAIGGMLITWASSYFTSRGLYAYAKAGAIAEEVLSSIRTVIAFGGEQKECQRYNEEIKSGRNVGIKKGMLLGFSTGYLFFVLFLSYSVAFWFGAWLVSEDYAQGGEILSVFFAVIIGAFAIGQALPNLEAFSSALGAGGAIFETLKRIPDIDSYNDEGVNPDNNDDVIVNNSIQFKDISFNYPARPDIEVLTSFNLSVNVGQTLALVGHSGCGKSTVMQLLQRFYDPLSGEIKIGDHSIKDINIKYLRQLIGIVSQEPVLFDLTIMDNIKFGNEDATVEEIKQAAKDANVHDFISQLPDGYDTLVGERGTQLSGGQKQRVAIARALIKNPKILLLDEATSALDSESEHLVQTALERASKGRTTIVIAHRLSTIQNADVIVVLDKGNIIESGTHGELMKLGGSYNEMVLAQTSGSVDDAYIATRTISTNDDQPKDNIARQFSRSISKQYSRQESHQQKTKEDIKREKMSGDELLKKKQAEWDKELASVPITRVMALNAREWYLIALGVLGAAVNGSIFPCFAFIFGEVLGVFTMRRDQVLDGIHLPAGLFLMLAVIAGIAIFVKTFCFAVSGEFLTERIRSRVFKAMLRQELGWFDQEQHSTGALTTRLSEDAAQVQGATGTRLATVVETFISLALALIIAFIYSWVVTLVILGFVPVLVVSNALKTIIFTRHAAKNKQAQTQAGKFAVDSVENIRTVTSFSLQNTFINIYDNETSKHYRVGLLMGILEGVAYGLSQGVTFFSYVIAFRFGAYIVSLDSDHFLHTEFQNILRVMFALVFGAVAVGQASAFAPNVAKAKISANRIFSLLDREPLIDNYSTDGQEIEGLAGGVEVDKVSFSYPTREDVPILQELSLSIKPGQTVALVGPSGCGKSTIVNLIERFYEPSGGSVKLDGVPLGDLNLRWLRSQLGIVSQEPILFDDSISGNIRYGANVREVTDDEIIEAAKSANINDFIQSLPQGYNTNVGDKGTQLSGGQKQRVAIARALIRNPKILLLDEATSALDSESEKVVQEALDKAREGRTSVVIAHRLSTILSADCIVVMSKGEIVEMGTHSELIALGGLYYQLYQHQQLGGGAE